MRCKTPGCGSYAINHGSNGRDGSDGDLCDVCYWRKRAGGLDDSQNMNLNCKSVQKRLATQWGFVPVSKGETT